MRNGELENVIYVNVCIQCTVHTAQFYLGISKGEQKAFFYIVKMDSDIEF
jgi:hypothetical protein